MLTRTVLLSLLLFAAHAKKTDHKFLEKAEKYKISKPSPSNSTSTEDEEKANVDNYHWHWYDKLWLYPSIMMLDSFMEAAISHLEQEPYKTIKKFDVSWDYPGLGSYFAKTLILKDYEERRYPSVNQACIEVEYEMPEQEEVVEEEDSDEEEGSFKKVMDWMLHGIKNMNKNKTESETDIMTLYTDLQKETNLSKYRSGVNKKGQEMEMTLPLIMSRMKKKVGYNNWTVLAVLTYIIPMS